MTGLAGVLVSVPAAPDATRWSGADIVGDATSYTFSPEPEPCGTIDFETTQTNDIMRLMVKHTRSRISVTARVAGLPARRDTAWSMELEVAFDRWGTGAPGEDSCLAPPLTPRVRVPRP